MSDIESKTSKTEGVVVSTLEVDQHDTSRMDTTRGLKSRHIQLMYVRVRHICTFEANHDLQARSAVSSERKILSRALYGHRLTSPSLAIVASLVCSYSSLLNYILTQSQSVPVVPWSWRVPYPVSSPTASSVSSSGPVSDYTALGLPSLTPNQSPNPPANLLLSM